jgi:hypothetical protein
MIQMRQDTNANFLSSSFFVITDRAEQIGYSANTFDCYSERPGFEPLLGYRLSSLSFSYFHQYLYAASESVSWNRCNIWETSKIKTFYLDF